MKVKELLEQLSTLDPEMDLSIEPVQSFVIRPVRNENDMERQGDTD